MLAGLIYPHQLFAKHPATSRADVCVLVEEPLLWKQYGFHAQKLILHRASMKAYQRQLERDKLRVLYVEAEQLDSTGDIAPLLKRLGVTESQCVDPCDDWLNARLSAALDAERIPLRVLNDPHFLTPWQIFEDFGRERKKWFFTDFYIQQRQRLDVLLDARSKPIGGQWSFDPQNRKKLPKHASVPSVNWPSSSKEVTEACDYVDRKFPDAPGERDSFRYPITRQQALAALDDFLDHRLARFGEFEDAMHIDEPILFHSVMTPSLNNGLLSPAEVVQAALKRSDDVPINSLEGFVRQVIGWREYIRGVYRQFGRRQRCSNAWQHHRPIPAAFYSGTTGIVPVDSVIHQVLRSGYCHHIERLMVLGNFMMLCEIHPDHVYRWFMELFIDAYDWVMVPNVYGMSQHADGGLITTKPYISGSNYIRKMSNYPKGEWCQIWDGLYWRFINKHRDFFAKNPRMAVMASQLDRMGDKLNEHLRVAVQFLVQLFEYHPKHSGGAHG